MYRPAATAYVDWFISCGSQRLD